MEHMLADKITAWCLKQKVMSESEAAVVTYGIELVFDTLLKLLGLVALGIIFGRLFEVLLSVACFSSLRCFAGGAHMRTSPGCFFSMVFVCTASCLGAILLPAVPIPVLIVLSAGILLLNGLFAPFFTQNNPIVDERILKRKKTGAVILAALLLTVIWLAPVKEVKLLMLIPVTIESLSILPCWHIGVNK